ncbi:hypothetical protein CCHL11_07840 [Colletotrichum chlorophyti]|uniref:MARVEL domain-containing protein n=1 Tax=Colletotrichum chlorophyti TaxID=708187 RepID=A0A1Q8RR56_9PEZI|nr:hypothetical protein CCHL11_07840 [Colletotrichum chlorophyti]
MSTSIHPPPPVAANQNAGWNPSVVGFLLFNSLWSLILLAYITVIPMYRARLFNQTVSLGLMAVTDIFWFAGAIAMASAVGAQWRTEQAVTAFSFFVWAIFTGVLVFHIIFGITARGNSKIATQA